MNQLVYIFLLVLLLCLLLLCSGLFSASETALFSLSPLKVKGYHHSSDIRNALIARLLAKPRDLLVTILILNVLVNILVQNVVSTIFVNYSNWGYSVGIPLAATLIFGEIIPKSIGLANNDQLARRVAPFLFHIQRLILPVRKVLVRVTSVVSRWLFFFLKHEREISVTELLHALKTSRQYGVLGEEEAELVRGYLCIQDVSVKEIMRPREEVLLFFEEEPLSRLVHLFVDLECSRIPVCKEGLDHVIGVMTSRNFFLNKQKISEVPDLLPLLDRPFFVPESMLAKSLLRQMHDAKESLALVVDEYGSVSGLISLEDLVEGVIGQISDRRDDKQHYTRAAEGTIIASGKLELSEFETVFNIALESKNNMVTIGGWLTEQMGDIPKSGAKYKTADFLFHVLSADPNRVRRIYIRRLGKRGT